MNREHAPDWIAASTLLREAMEHYRDQKYYTSLPRVVDDLINYIERHSGKWLHEKTIRRDAGNSSHSTTIHRIPDWRVRIYTRWLFAEVGKDQEWLAKWLECTAYASPGKLLAELRQPRGDLQRVYRTVKTNVPPLNKRLWGRFLGRQAELEKLRRWADQQRLPIAVLYGFGGSGKTTLQQKMGLESVHGAHCPLRWPYDAAVWVSATDYPRGQPDLNEVLRQIADTCGLYEGYSREEIGQIPPQTLRNDVATLLERMRILALLDNFETIAAPHQRDILQFFHDLHGTSQLLISTRHRPDWLLGQEDRDLYQFVHLLIQVDGLSSQDAEQLIQDVLEAKSLPQTIINEHERTRLLAVTRNNPKTILAVLGLVEQGLALSPLLDTITSGTPAADTIYTMVIDRAWQEFLSATDQAVLMAKALFRHTVCDRDLGHIAGVDEPALQHALKKLAAISFFEFEPTSRTELRISTHPLAQEFARRVLHDHPEIAEAMEARWWRDYAPQVVQQAGQTPYEALHPALKEDVANVLDQVALCIHERSAYTLQAAKLFGGNGGLGSFLVYWGELDEVLRVGHAVLEIAIEQRDPELLAECGLCLVARIYVSRHDFAQADRYLGLIVEQNAHLQHPWLAAMIEFGRVLIYMNRGYLRAAQQACQTTRQQFLEVQDDYYTALTDEVWGETLLNEVSNAVDTARVPVGKYDDLLLKAETCATESEHYLAQCLQHARADLDSQYTVLANRFLRGRITRLRGQLADARTIFADCIGKIPTLWGTAHLYCELALVEHLDGNRQLAYTYAEKSLALFRKLNITTPTIQCYKVITNMKRDGTW
jgi:hypothetical protein